MVEIQHRSLPHNSISPRGGSDTHDAHRLEYLAEGNANVVYAFKPLKEGLALPSSLKHKLLRIRKDKPFIRSTSTQLAAYQEHFVPLFHADNIVEYTSINVDQAVIRSLNKDLEGLEQTGRRAKLRYGDILALDEETALLMTDMTAGPGECLFEIKPKWLQQSPDAPSNSVQCRTCALRLQRTAAKAQGATTPNPIGFCPLSLVDENIEERRKAFEKIVRSQTEHVAEITESIIKFMTTEGCQVFHDLRRYQSQFDDTGLLESTAEDISLNYLKAMTLRDCLVFVKGSLNDFANTAEIRLADLDLKQAHPDKVEKWKSTEKRLIDDGWYTNDKAEQNSLEPICLLSRRSHGNM